MICEKTTVPHTRECLLRRLEENLRRAYGLEKTQIDHLVQTAIANISSECAKLEMAAKHQDTDQVQAIAHSLKGILLNLRLKEQAAIAEMLQHLDTVQQSSGMERLVKRLQESLIGFAG